MIRFWWQENKGLIEYMTVLAALGLLSVSPCFIRI